MVGAPHFFSSTTLRPFGPRVTRTASASLFMPASSPRRASSSNAMIFGIRVSSRIGTLELRLLIQPDRAGLSNRPGRVLNEVMRIAVIGAGVGGLGTALALSRQGHDV